MSDSKDTDLSIANSVYMLSCSVAVAIALSQGNNIAAASALAVAGVNILGKTMMPSFFVKIGAVWQDTKANIGEEKADTYARTQHGNDVLTTVFTRIIDAPDAATLPTFAAIITDYAARGDAPDRFLRQSARMLVECDSDDIALLTKVAVVAGAAAVDDGFVKMTRHINTRDNLGVYADKFSGPSIPMATSNDVTGVDTDRLLYLLGSHGLARATTFDSAPPRAFNPNNRVEQRPADGLIMTTDYARRLARILPAPQT